MGTFVTGNDALVDDRPNPGYDNSGRRIYSTESQLMTGLMGAVEDLRAALNQTFDGRVAASESFGALDLSLARAAVPQSPLSTPTPYTGDELVHPSVAFNPTGWNGFKFWMGVTPYEGTDSAVENPSIYCSHDGQTWSTPAGLTNPVIPAIGGTDYNSDPEIVWGHDRKLYMFYRTTVSGRDSIYVTSSSDGVTWASSTLLFSPLAATERPASPTVLWDGAQWVMYYVDVKTGTRPIRRRTSSSLTSGWSEGADVTITSPPTGQDYWHIAARMVGGRVVMLINDTTSGGTGSSGDLYWAWSDNGTTFTRASEKAMRRGGWANSGLYRSTFLPLNDGVETRLAIWLSGQGSTGWKVGYAEATVGAPVADVVQTWGIPERHFAHAARGASYLAAFDNFARPDSATALGTSPSGHVWTVTGTGVPGISSGQACLTAANNTKMTTDCGFADGRVGMRIAEQGTTTSHQKYLALRFQDTNNYIRFGSDGTTGYKIERIASGAVAQTHASLLCAPVDGDWIEMSMSGSTLTAYINGREVWTGTDANFTSETDHGFIMDNTTVRVSAWYAHGAAVAAPIVSRGAHNRVTVTYSASMTLNAAQGNQFVITATNSTAFTVNAPTGPATGQRICITLRNTSGGALGAATWNAAFKMAAWTNPATANSRSIDFVYDGTNWVEVARTAADVPN